MTRVQQPQQGVYTEGVSTAASCIVHFHALKINNSLLKNNPVGLLPQPGTSYTSAPKGDNYLYLVKYLVPRFKSSQIVWRCSSGKQNNVSEGVCEKWMKKTLKGMSGISFYFCN